MRARHGHRSDPWPQVSLRVKRALDLVAAGGGLLLAAPVLGVVAVAIRTTMGSPILFRQQRPGLHGEPFEIFKLRTMIDPVDAHGNVLETMDRVTPLGKWLRRTSLDELPELLNVIRGDMSIVGPRPLLMEYLPRFSPEQARRHDVRPGITGLAQVAGRHDLGWEQRFELDVWYVDHWSLWLDLRIVLRTFRQVTQGQDAPDSTAPDFYFLGDSDDADQETENGDEQEDLMSRCTA